jgi:hypothetical protein
MHGADGKAREVVCLPLELLAGWIFGVTTSKVRPELREKLTRYREECYGVLWEAFRDRVVAVPGAVLAESDAIAELQRIAEMSRAIARLADQQIELQRQQQRLNLLRASANCADVSWPGFEHAVGDPVEDASTVPASTRLVIVEDLYRLHHADGWEAIYQSFDERWYLDTPLGIALERLALRHMQAWGITRDAADHRIAASDQRPLYCSRFLTTGT